MSQFIYFTPEEKARAQNTDLVSLLRAQGERPVRSGREFRTPNDPSITVRGNKWFDHSARVGGYAVSFVQRYYRLPYPEAVLLLLVPFILFPLSQNIICILLASLSYFLMK